MRPGRILARMSNGAGTGRTSPGKQSAALIVMVGAPGSGKSYLGRQVSAALDARLIQTDAVRKQLFPNPRYTPGEASAVYDACHRMIAEALAGGECVVFDGTNLQERHRTTLYRLAEQTGARLAVVVARAPEAVIRARLRQRIEAPSPTDQSDADWPIYLRLRRDAEPVLRPHVVVNTTVSPAPVLRLLRRQLEG
ncbi:MAG: ATP-binding protein [Chloroflexi bacterium]|nr:ATP-binding protein [Chloroflexota bacterium]